MFVKGKTTQLSVTIDADITDWKIRAVVFDNENFQVQLATANSGGSDDQIEKTSEGASSVFVIKIASGLTFGINDEAFLEIEADTGVQVGGENEIITILSKYRLEFEDSKIDWTTPNA